MKARDRVPHRYRRSSIASSLMAGWIVGADARMLRGFVPVICELVAASAATCADALRTAGRRSYRRA
jgi:hypothetical protein